MFTDLCKHTLKQGQKLVEQVGSIDPMSAQITKWFEDSTISNQFSSKDIIDVVLGFKRSSSCGPDDISSTISTM